MKSEFSNVVVITFKHVNNYVKCNIHLFVNVCVNINIFTANNDVKHFVKHLSESLNCY